jgi:hypothetical protein
LYQTAGHHDTLAIAVLFLINGFANGLERFLFGGFEKAAGIDHDGVGRRGIGGYRQPILRKQAQHPLAVHKILWTAKADERHRLNFPGRFGHQSSRNSGPSV